MTGPGSPNPTAQTAALRRLLARPMADSAVADLLFLEAWERDPAPGPAAARRVGQIRRANPNLARAIRQEIAAQR